MGHRGRGVTPGGLVLWPSIVAPDLPPHMLPRRVLADLAYDDRHGILRGARGPDGTHGAPVHGAGQHRGPPGPLRLCFG